MSEDHDYSDREVVETIQRSRETRQRLIKVEERLSGIEAGIARLGKNGGGPGWRQQATRWGLPGIGIGGVIAVILEKLMT